MYCAATRTRCLLNWFDRYFSPAPVFHVSCICPASSISPESRWSLPWKVAGHQLQAYLQAHLPAHFPALHHRLLVRPVHQPLGQTTPILVVPALIQGHTIRIHKCIHVWKVVMRIVLNKMCERLVTQQQNTPKV